MTAIARYRPSAMLLSLALLPTLFIFSQPVINSYTPTAGPVGTQVILSGSNFSPTPANNIVFMGAVRANVTAATASSLTITVPAGATYQPITVTVNSLTASSSKPFIVTFPGGQPIVQFGSSIQTSFEPQINFPTDLHPNGVAIADFDGDGKADMATANNYSTSGQPASVSILKNNGSIANISFEDHQDIPTGVLTYAIASGDLNGDGKPDMVSCSVLDKTISVFRNTSTSGNISFAPKIDYPTDENPFSIAIADIDVDGRPDIIVANYLSGTISVYRNTGSGGNISFAARVNFTPALSPRCVAASDLDGDNKPDLVVACELSNTISILRNTSSGSTISFAPRIDIVGSGNSMGVALGDLDLDGKTDVVIANNTTLKYSVLRNTSSTGNISFAPKVDYACGASPYNPSIGDLNGDGKPDIVIASANVSVSQNQCTPGTISFGDKMYLFQTFTPYVVGIGDFDGDGKSDLADAGFNTQQVSVHRNKNNEPTIFYFNPTSGVTGTVVTIYGSGFNGATAVSFGGVPATSFTIADDQTITAVVGAGASGIVAVSNQYGTNKRGGFTYHGPPKISSFTPTAAGTGNTVIIKGNFFEDISSVSFGGTAAASFTIKSLDTVIAIVGSGATGQVKMTNPYGSDSMPGFIYYPLPVITSFTPASGGIGTNIEITGANFSTTTNVTIGGTAAASFVVNSSTSITALVAEGAAGTIRVTTLGGSAASSTGFTFPAPTISSFIPTVGPVGTTVTITGTNFRSNPAGNIVYFGAAKANVISSSTTSLTVTVPPGSTYQPITVSTNNYTAFSSQPFITTFPDASAGISSTSFVWKKGLPTNEDPRILALGDLDGDGKTDIVSSNYFSGTISVLRNISTNNHIDFEPAQDLFPSIGTNARMEIALGDINGDGKPDLIVANWYQVVSVLKNTSAPGSISFAPRVDFPATELCLGITINDFDGDGKADFALASTNYSGAGSVMAVYRNTGNNDIISFAPSADFSLGVDIAFDIHDADFDNNGKPDIAESINHNAFKIFRNTSTPGTISFSSDLTFIIGTLGSESFAVGDVDSDGKFDLLSYGDGKFSVFRNTTTGPTMSFGPRIDFDASTAYDITVGQLDGDGKLDVAVANDRKVFVYRNTSTPGTVSFTPRVEFATQVTYNWIHGCRIADVDNDGKSDLIVANGADNKVSVLRNEVYEASVPTCLNQIISLISNIVGSNYQWQVNTGSGFINLSNNVNYNNVTAATLQINNAPISWTSYQYRCVVDGNYSRISNLVIYPNILPKGTAGSTGQVCVNDNFSLTFTEINDVAVGSQLQIWESSDGSPFTFPNGATYNYYGYSTNYAMSVVTTPVTKRYFFKILPPQDAMCTATVNSDTTTVVFFKLAIPILTVNGNTMTVTNPDADPTAFYTWQIKPNGATQFGDVYPAVFGTSFTPTISGLYRVRVKRANCFEYSAEQQLTITTVTAINPIPASTVGIHAYPNPVRDKLRIDTLKLADKWQTVSIVNAEGRQVIANASIKNQATVVVDVSYLPAGMYTATLRRKEGPPVFIKFIRL